MLLLAVDTTTPHASVAILDGDAVRAARRAEVSTHSEALLPMVDAALAEARVRLADLDGLACGGGPGSFTGLRIGLATVKGLCLATGKPLVLVPSLEALAARAPAGAEVLACLDAFKGELYVAGFVGGLPPARRTDDRTAAPAIVADMIAASHKPLHLVGDGVLRYPALRVEGVLADDTGPPDAVEVARLAALRLGRGERDDLASASPRYVRPSEAELMAAKRPRQDG